MAKKKRGNFPARNNIQCCHTFQVDEHLEQRQRRRRRRRRRRGGWQHGAEDVHGAVRHTQHQEALADNTLSGRSKEAGAGKISAQRSEILVKTIYSFHFELNIHLINILIRIHIHKPVLKTLWVAPNTRSLSKVRVRSDLRRL